MLNDEQLSQMRQHLEDGLPCDTRELLAEALNGSIEAATQLANYFPDRKKGRLVLAFACLKGPTEAYRALMRKVWEHNHELIIEAAATRDLLQLMLEYAPFDKSHLTDSVTLYRGTSVSAADVVWPGYSWTTDRDTACWFAIEQKNASRKPIVLQTTVRKEAVYVLPSEMDENEVIVLDPPPAWIDGFEDDWLTGALRRAIKKR